MPITSAGTFSVCTVSNTFAQRVSLIALIDIKNAGSGKFAVNSYQIVCNDCSSYMVMSSSPRAENVST